MDTSEEDSSVELIHLDRCSSVSSSVHRSNLARHFPNS